MKTIPHTLFAMLTATGLLLVCGCKPVAPETEQATATEVAVQTAKVVRTTLRKHVEGYGTVEPEPAGGGKPAGAARLSPALAGVVMSVPAKEGEHVEAGALIVKLDDRAALAQLHLAEQQMKRQNELKDAGGTSEKAVQEATGQLATAQVQLAQVHLVTPIAGVVARIDVQPGQTVDMNTVVAEIVDNRRLVVSVSIPVDAATELKPGQVADIKNGSGDQSIATGTVVFVSPQVDPQTGAVLVRVTLPADSGLRPGQFVRVLVVSEEHANRLAVPRESVVTDVEGNSTIAVVAGDRARRVPATVGVSEGNLVEVESAGLKEGDVVVTTGAYGLPGETRVKIVSQ